MQTQGIQEYLSFQLSDAPFSEDAIMPISLDQLGNVGKGERMKTSCLSIPSLF